MTERTITVYSPDADEHVTGTIYHETDTYVCIETPAGRIVGGPKRLLLTPDLDTASSASRQRLDLIADPPPWGKAAD